MSASRLKCICALCMLLIWHFMTANDLTTSLLLLVRGRRQLSFARDPSEGGGQITSKGDGLLRSNLPLGDTLPRGAGYFVTYLTAMFDNCVPRRQLGSCSVTRPFLSLRRVWLARLAPSRGGSSQAPGDTTSNFEDASQWSR